MLIKNESIIYPNNSNNSNNLMVELESEAKSAVLSCLGTIAKQEQDYLTSVLKGKKIKVVVSLEID